jgi:exoribonuclease II
MEKKKKYNVTPEDIKKVAIAANVTVGMVRMVANGERASKGGLVEKHLKTIGKLRTFADKSVEKVVKKIEHLEKTVQL